MKLNKSPKESKKTEVRLAKEQTSTANGQRQQCGEGQGGEVGVVVVVIGGWVVGKEGGNGGHL